MKLTKKEQALLDGKHGLGLKKAIEILVALGQIYGAKEMVAVTSAQIAGVSYKNIGDPGLEFLRDWADQNARVHIPAFMNPAGIDRQLWRQLGFPEEFAQKQLEIIEALKRMGVRATLTCTPYHIGIVPQKGEHIAWSESSAVCYANSVLGARTNREGGPSALAAAFCGRTPRFGLHLHENRLATHRVLVNCQLKSSADFGLLGYVVGKKIGNGVPFFHGIDLPADETARIVCLKALGAAMAASGAVALYHIEDFTPEAIAYGERMIKQNAAVIEIQYLEDARIVLNQQGNQIDLVTLGCPHASLEELRVIAEMIGQRQLKKPLWIATSAIVREDARANGWLEIIERAGGKVLADTCMVVAPLEEMGIKYIATNSAKAATYLPSHQAAVVRYGTTEQCVQAAINGHF
ncbi:MAG: aconitase X catalytic domain-containing protein [candidate division KSB1 bacterium]|nr:aconitase X catalytic domain-containing protein [candidate division KSB1 bacterium]MDZ7356299.1 aconitase X catalytic domain-containing protein [candidate division KSB1 bacterium]